MMDSRMLDSIAGLAEKAGRVALESRKSCLRELKEDGSIVTNGDIAAEGFLRPELSKLIPGAAIWGEEGEFETESDKGLWLVDPIDGTSNYAYGSPLWGVSIAYYLRGSILAGVIVLPELNETFTSLKGGGAKLNGRELSKIPAGEIHASELVGYDERLLALLGDQSFPGKMRHIGAFVVEAAWVATQRMRGMVAVRGKMYDFAAGLCLCRELDADVRYLDGSAINDEELCQFDRNSKPIAILPCQSGIVVR